MRSGTHQSTFRLRVFGENVTQNRNETSATYKQQKMRRRVCFSFSRKSLRVYLLIWNSDAQRVKNNGENKFKFKCQQCSLNIQLFIVFRRPVGVTRAITEMLKRASNEKMQIIFMNRGLLETRVHNNRIITTGDFPSTQTFCEQKVAVFYIRICVRGKLSTHTSSSSDGNLCVWRSVGLRSAPGCAYATINF